MRGISDRIKWSDAAGYREVPNLIKKFDVLVLPSRTTKIWMEQFGRVLIEAMAVGVPFPVLEAIPPHLKK